MSAHLRLSSTSAQREKPRAFRSSSWLKTSLLKIYWPQNRTLNTKSSSQKYSVNDLEISHNWLENSSACAWNMIPSCFRNMILKPNPFFRNNSVGAWIKPKLAWMSCSRNMVACLGSMAEIKHATRNPHGHVHAYYTTYLPEKNKTFLSSH